MLGKKSPAVNTRSPRITGICGAGRSVGTTHLAVWSANYLASCCQKKTAVVEWSSHSDFVWMIKMDRLPGLFGCWR